MSRARVYVKREREWKHVKPKPKCERKRYHDMQVYSSFHHEKYNNIHIESRNMSHVKPKCKRKKNHDV